MHVIAGNGSFYFVNDANLNAHKAKVSKKKNRDARTASNAKSIEPSMPCVDIRQLVVAVYFSSRMFHPAVTKYIIEQRLGETIDPDIHQEVDSLMYAKFCEEDVLCPGETRISTGLVDEWLNEQMSYEELVEVTKFDNYVQQVYDEAVGALVLYIKSND